MQARESQPVRPWIGEVTSLDPELETMTTPTSRYVRKDRIAGALAGRRIARAWAARSPNGSDIDGAVHATPRPTCDSEAASRLRETALLLALTHHGSDEALMADAASVEATTPERVSCMLHALWVRAGLAGDTQPWEAAVASLRTLGPAAAADLTSEAIDDVLGTAMDRHIAGNEDMQWLWEARRVLEADDDFERAVRRALAEGSDRAVADIVGALAGIRRGLYGLPNTERQALLNDPAFISQLDAVMPRMGMTGEEGDRDIVRTSVTHPMRIGTIALRGGGTIGVTFCPGKQQRQAMTGRWARDLEQDLDAIVAWGATHLVTLVESRELEELGVSGLGNRARAKGLRWHHAPIPDGLAPGDAFEDVWNDVLPPLLTALQSGEGVIVHCKGGLGRAGTTAALLLHVADPQLTLDEVVTRVREARPQAIETVTQERYLQRVFAAPLKTS
jgi:protein-tyrosine phosphatase